MIRLMSLRFSSTRASWPLKTAKGSAKIMKVVLYALAIFIIAACIFAYFFDK